MPLSAEALLPVTATLRSSASPVNSKNRMSPVPLSSGFAPPEPEKVAVSAASVDASSPTETESPLPPPLMSRPTRPKLLTDVPTTSMAPSLEPP